MVISAQCLDLTITANYHKVSTRKSASLISPLFYNLDHYKHNTWVNDYMKPESPFI